MDIRKSSGDSLNLDKNEIKLPQLMQKRNIQNQVGV